jgi:DUF4097 and DUF4098 domain-containing protein YvlB
MTGCSFRGGWSSSTPSHKYEKTVEVAGPMSANRAFCATTTNGNIKVLGSEELNCAVTAKITARGWSDEEAKAVADQVKITIVETGKKTDVVVHKPDIELKKHIGISFDIRLPGNSSLDLTTVNGNITSSGVAGPVEIITCNGNVSCRDVAQNVKARTTNGNIDVACSADAVSIKTVQAKTINGAIKFKSPNDYSARVEASTLNGAVHSDIPISVKGKIKRNRLNGVIGKGKGTLHLRTINGVIFIQ